jgi:transporter family protein
MILPGLKADLESDDEDGSQGLVTLCIALGYVSCNAILVLMKLKSIHLNTFKKQHCYSMIPGFLTILGMGSYSSLLERDGANSVLAPLAGGLYILVPIFFGTLLLKEPMTLQKFGGIIFAVAAIVLLSVKFPGVGDADDVSVNFSDPMTILYLMICFFGWGFATLTMVLLGKSSDDHNWVQVMSSCGIIIGAVVAAFAIQHDVTLQYLSYTSSLVVGSGIFLFLGHIFFYKLARVNQQASVLAPLCGLYVILPIVFGIAVLGESVTYVQIIGIILAIVAIFLMSADLKLLKAALITNRTTVHPEISTTDSVDLTHPSLVPLKTLDHTAHPSVHTINVTPHEASQPPHQSFPTCSGDTGTSNV